jgi:DNA-binding XRE family transcriptional regulator
MISAFTGKWCRWLKPSTPATLTTFSHHRGIDMAKPLSELQMHMEPATLERAHERAQQISAAIRLAALRKENNTTQKELAERMHISQASISQMESQGDMQISTLLRYIHALGGTINIQVEIGGQTTILMQA